MVNDGLDYDIRSILECRENEESELFQRLTAFCQGINARTAASLEAYEARMKAYELKQETVNENIAHLHKVLKDKNVEREDIVLQQKVTDKKIALATEERAKLEEDIADALSKKENISLETVELTQEFEATRKQRKERWNAIKMACTYYKEHLDIHISLDQCNDHDRVKVTFFQKKNPDRDNYYVLLENRNNDWKVLEIVPELEEKQMEKINAKVDCAKPMKTRDVTALLCALRATFLKYYTKE